jgi:hypothetical protein
MVLEDVSTWPFDTVLPCRHSLFSHGTARYLLLVEGTWGWAWTSMWLAEVSAISQFGT